MSINEEYDKYIKTKKWQKKRSKRFKIDNFTCQRCGSKKNLDVHHLTYDNFRNEDVYRDLITLCRSCHSKIEQEKKQANVGKAKSVQQAVKVQQEPSFSKAFPDSWIYSGIYYSKMPTDEFLINRLSHVYGGEGYKVYYKHNRQTDTLSQGIDSISYTVNFEYDIVPLFKRSFIDHIFCKAEIISKGAFAFYPKVVRYYYKDGTIKNLSCNGFELLNDDCAVVEIFNNSGPHPNCPWKTIRGSNILHKNVEKEKKQTKNSGNCYVATATYQDASHPNVVLLRDFRDKFLQKSIPGRLFIRFYYMVGPYAAYLPKHFSIIRNLSKAVIDSIVSKIKRKYYK